MKSKSAITIFTQAIGLGGIFTLSLAQAADSYQLDMDTKYRCVVETSSTDKVKVGMTTRPEFTLRNALSGEVALEGKDSEAGAKISFYSRLKVYDLHYEGSIELALATDVTQVKEAPGSIVVRRRPKPNVPGWGKDVTLTVTVADTMRAFDRETRKDTLILSGQSDVYQLACEAEE